MDFAAMAQYLPLYETAMWLTLRIGWIGIIGSIVIGLVVAMVNHFKVPVLHQLCRAYVELFRNTPLLIQLFFIYFGLPRLGLSISAEACGMLGVALAAVLTALALAFTDEGFQTAAGLLLAAHAPIMLVEGVITMFTVSFIARVRPEMLRMAQPDASRSRNQ